MSCCVSRFQQILKKISNSPIDMFPLAYAVMSEKTKSLYQFVLDRILLRTGPGEGVGIIRMVSDYEFAILNAMEHAFPGGHSRGCWFILDKQFSEKFAQKDYGSLICTGQMSRKL
ncbi:hypothetical protein OUZ56_010551 [Daphnia magna]|uniref:MULE transposase domain-containing protein n=1 Tax=Daphnia magna TaxID=35525 RepID=A0ABR0AIV6_9CRUS|nr:hypothetical protein OUZ56_010551 [Daphnia magna]